MYLQMNQKIRNNSYKKYASSRLVCPTDSRERERERDKKKKKKTWIYTCSSYVRAAAWYHSLHSERFCFFSLHWIGCHGSDWTAFHGSQVPPHFTTPPSDCDLGSFVQRATTLKQRHSAHGGCRVSRLLCEFGRSNISISQNCKMTKTWAQQSVMHPPDHCVLHYSNAWITSHSRAAALHNQSCTCLLYFHCWMMFFCIILSNNSKCVQLCVEIECINTYGHWTLKIQK